MTVVTMHSFVKRFECDDRSPKYSFFLKASGSMSMASLDECYVKFVWSWMQMAVSLTLLKDGRK